MSELYSENDWRNYQDSLEHHGIKGQEWGKKNGPPYPLDRETHGRVVRGDRVSDSKRRMHIKNPPSDGEYPKFTDDMAKKYLINHPIEKMGEMLRISKNADINDIRFKINHPGDKTGRFYNCPNCATAFEMVERGYDVEARPKKNGSNVEDIESFFKNGSLKPSGVNELSDKTIDAWKAYKEYSNRPKPLRSDKTWDDLQNKYFYYHELDGERAMKNTLKEIEDQGKGSRGIIVVGWFVEADPSYKTTMFHALNYKNENGKVVFYDTQSKRQYNGYTDSSFLQYDVDPREIFLMRTDNLEMSDRVGEAVASRRKR